MRTCCFGDSFVNGVGDPDDLGGVPDLPVVGPLHESDVWLKEAGTNDGAHPGAGGYAALAALVNAWPAWQAWWRRNA